MDVASLLNAVPVDHVASEEIQNPGGTSTRRSSSSTPTPAPVHHTNACPDLEDHDAHAEDIAPFHRSDTRGSDPNMPRKGWKIGDDEAWPQSRRLNGDQSTDKEGVPLENSRLHRFSDSLSSISSHDSTLSLPHSRTSSVTTVGDEGVASVSFADAFEDAKLATVQEETLLRAHGRKSGRRRTGCQPRAPLRINTDVSNRGSSQRKRHLRSMSNVRGATSSSRLTGCTQLPPAPGSLSSGSKERRGSAWHTRTVSAPGATTTERPYQARHAPNTILERPPVSTMDHKHVRKESTGSASSNPVYISQPGSPYASEPQPPVAPREPGTPSSAFSYVRISTPQSASSVESPYAHSASTTDAAMSRQLPFPDTPTRPSRARAETHMSATSENDTHGISQQECVAQEGCKENSVMRKVISHFFGRNKKCTSLIPPHVWIVMCRKHYQRTRYRNADNFPMYQIDLILKQIDKIAEWIESGAAKGQSTPVRSWTIAVRKRSSNNSALIPDWIQQIAGSGHTTERVRAAAERIESELQQKLYNEVPEVEFLPDIDAGVAGGSARRERKKHVRQTSSLSSGYLGGTSRNSSLDVNVQSHQPSLGDSNAYLDDARRQIQRSQERVHEGLRYFNAEHQRAAEQSAIGPYASEVPPPTMPPPELGGASYYQIQTPQSSQHPSMNPWAAYAPQDDLRDAPNHNGQSPGDQLPSFNTGFASAWGTKVKGEPVDHNGVAHSTFEQPSRYQSAFAGRNPFTGYGAHPVAVRGQGAFTPANSPSSYPYYGTQPASIAPNANPYASSYTMSYAAPGGTFGPAPAGQHSGAGQYDAAVGSSYFPYASSHGPAGGSMGAQRGYENHETNDAGPPSSGAQDRQH